jgi:hypothetical protein
MALTLNILGDEKRQQPKPVTLPKVVLRTLDDDAREIAEAATEKRIIRAGIDAWDAIKKAESFAGWLAIGKALQVGKEVALKSTGANSAWGQVYSKAFSEWIKRHHFDRMPSPTRSVAIELAENAEAITVWRDSLPEKQKRRLVHPLSVTRRWRAATTHNGKSPTDLKRDATAAWRRFVVCVKALPPDMAAPLWQAAQTQATAFLGADSRRVFGAHVPKYEAAITLSADECGSH